MPQNEAKLASRPTPLKDLVPNNSDKAQSRPKTIERPKPMIKGKVTIKKPSAWSKFKEAFIGSQEGSIGDFVIYDVLVPALRGTISDLGVGIIEEMFGGGRRSYGYSRRDQGRRSLGYVSYNSPPPSYSSRRERPSTFENIAFPTRGSAEDVLAYLQDIIYEYGCVSIRAFYEAAGLEAYHTDENYGWTNLNGVRISRDRDGFVIDFPRPVLLR